MSKEVRKEILRENRAWELPENLTLEQTEVGEMYAFWIKNKDAEEGRVLLNFHGGAYIMSLENHPVVYERMAANYSSYGGIDVLTVDYRTAPDHPYPAALEDAVFAYEYLLGEGYAAENIIIAGSSAGGGLALSLALYLRDNGMEMPGAIITMSAWADLTNHVNLSAPYVGDNDATLPYISPAYGEYDGFPMMLIQVGDEPVTADSQTVYEKSLAAGADATLTKYDGMPHVFQNLSPEREQVSAAWTEVGSFIKNAAGLKTGG